MNPAGKAGEDGLRLNGLAAESAAGNDGDRGAVESSHGSRFFGGVTEPLLGDCGLDFEDGVDAFGGERQAGGRWHEWGCACIGSPEAQ